MNKTPKDAYRQYYHNRLNLGASHRVLTRIEPICVHISGLDSTHLCTTNLRYDKEAGLEVDERLAEMEIPRSSRMYKQNLILRCDWNEAAS